MITAALPGHQAEAAARECRRWTCTAQMNHRSQLLPLLMADFRLSAMAENRSDVAVQEHRGELGGVAWHDPRMEQGRGTAGLNDGMAENAIALRLRLTTSAGRSICGFFTLSKRMGGPSFLIE